MRRTFRIHTDCGCSRLMSYPHHGYLSCRTRHEAGNVDSPVHGLSKVVLVEKAGFLVGRRKP